MAPGAGRATAADEQWLSLRRRHDAELRDFQQQVQEQKKVFLQNVEQARAKLLADHADQEKLFWTESGRSATVGAKRVAASKTDVQSSTRKHSTAPAAQVPIANSATLEAGQTPRSVQPQLAAVPSAPRPANKKAAVAYIDLCSDDDEPIVLQTKPASTFATTPILAKSESLSSTEVDTAATHEAPIYPIPSANLELFGSNSKTFQGIPRPSPFEREKSVFSQPSSLFMNTSRLPASRYGDGSTLAGSGSPSWSSAPPAPAGTSPFEQRTRLDKTHSSNPLPSQEARGSEITTSIRPSNGFSSWATPTMAAFQGCNMQRQASMIPSVSTAKPDQSNNGATAKSAAREMLPRASTVGFGSQQRLFGNLNLSSGKQPTSLDGPGRGGTRSLQNRLNSTSLKGSVHPPHEYEESLFIPDRSTPKAAMDTVPAGQRQKMSASLADGVLESSDEDRLMHEAPCTPPRPSSVADTPTMPGPKQYTPNMLPSPSSPITAPRASKKQAGRTHPSNLATAHVSIATPLSSLTPSTHTFRKPFLPASATKDIRQNAQRVRAGSQASSSSLAASTVSRSPRGTSITSQTSVSSMRTRGSKRKVVDISDEEESDYAAPSAEEDEPASPRAAEAAKELLNESTKAKKPAPEPVAKKAKLAPPQSTSASKGRNTFGILHMSHTPPRTPKSKPALSKSNTPTPTVSKPTKPASGRSASIQLLQTRSIQRKAKLDAEERISQLRAKDETFWTEETIVEADAQEAGIVDKVGASLRHMSITPTPSVVGSEDVEMLSNDDADTGKEGWTAWKNARSAGDRRLARSSVRASPEEDELDISGYSVVDGIIVSVAEAEELTQEQHVRLGPISDGGHGAERRDGGLRMSFCNTLRDTLGCETS